MTSNALFGLMNLGKETRAEKEQRFYTAVGEFVCSFAKSEIAMYILLHHLLKLKVWKSRALIGGQNMGALVALTKRVAARCVGPRKGKELSALLTQLEVINQFRHDLIHRGAEVSEKEIRSDNFFSAKTEDAAEEMILEIDHVSGAVGDLLRIRARIFRLVDKGERMTAERRKVLFAPWQYKPLARQKMWTRLLAEGLRRSPQPQSSPQ